MHRPRKDRWAFGKLPAKGTKQRQPPRTVQFPADTLYTMPFQWERRFDPVTGRKNWIPLERRTRPTGVTLLDDYVEAILDRRLVTIEGFCRDCQLEQADLMGLVFALTGVSPSELRLRLEMRMADDLLRYTSLPPKEVARLSGIGTATNLYYACTREYNQSPTDRRWSVREAGDEDRYRVG